MIPWTVAPRLLCPWDSLGKNTGVGCHFLLQGIFLTQGWNPCPLHCQLDSLPLRRLQGLLLLLQFSTGETPQAANASGPEKAQPWLWIQQARLLHHLALAQQRPQPGPAAAPLKRNAPSIRQGAQVS